MKNSTTLMGMAVFVLIAILLGAKETNLNSVILSLLLVGFYVVKSIEEKK